MESLPSAIVQFIHEFRPLFRAEVFDSFTYLFLGLLMGEAKYGTVRAAVFAPAAYQPQRLSDLFCLHKLSHQAWMARLTGLVLKRLYGGALPERLFWIADSTQTEKPYAEAVAATAWFHRSKRVAGRGKNLKGHCYVFAAHLYQHTSDQVTKWASLLVGALLYVKGRSIPLLVADLAQQMRLPDGVRHCWIVDRGIVSRSLLREVDKLKQFLIGRLRRNQNIYFAPAETKGGGRPRVYGEKCRVDELLKRYPARLRCRQMKLRVWGEERKVEVYDIPVLLRAVFKGRALQVRIIIIRVPELPLAPWYLLTTDLELAPCEVVRAYDGRYQIEVNMDEVKELGLGHYQGRSAQGVRRWPLFLCAVQTLLKLIATGQLKAELPKLHWDWYTRENTVGQVRRRLIEHCRPRLSREKVATATSN
jgi:hypothetical protein